MRPVAERLANVEKGEASEQIIAPILESQIQLKHPGAKLIKQARAADIDFKLVDADGETICWVEVKHRYSYKASFFRKNPCGTVWRKVEAAKKKKEPVYLVVLTEDNWLLIWDMKKPDDKGKQAGWKGREIQIWGYWKWKTKLQARKIDMPPSVKRK